MVGLAMKTSKAELADRNQPKAKLNRDAYVDSFPYVESYVDNNPYVESSVNIYAYVEVQLYLLCWYNEEKTYQLLFKVKKKRTADEQYYEENQQLSEQLLNSYDKENTTAERTAVEQFVGVHSAFQTQSTFRMERING
ncbi:hypothetical protein F511_12709 [Dorcoceras hygrometricum]|uniref:Uncharacterized protein n=1 Tax=Dorcoceras hygrometricum TaxID=472368 RepID=A0A2Z7D8Q8_9LAMI|nr:hypothetical protein F511_12709 [Dorcoceras hygrometricum]